MPVRSVLHVTRRVVAGLLLTGVATLGLGGLAHATTVSPASYATAICGAVATVHTNNTAAEASLSALTQAYKDQPTPANATALRQGLVGYLEQARTNFRSALKAFQKAGVPAGNNGSEFAGALNKNLRDALAALDPVIRKANAIDVSSTTGFATGVQDVFDRLSAASEISKKQARQAAAFKHVPAALQPIVSYVRGKGDTCAGT